MYHEIAPGNYLLDRKVMNFLCVVVAFVVVVTDAHWVSVVAAVVTRCVVLTTGAD